MKVELTKLRADLHNLVDSIKDEQLLRALHIFLRENKSRIPGKLWKSLTEEQKQEVLLASNDSLHKENLVEASSVFTTYKSDLDQQKHRKVS